MPGNVWIRNGLGWKKVKPNGNVGEARNGSERSDDPAALPEAADAFVNWPVGTRFQTGRKKDLLSALSVPSGGWLLNANRPAFDVLPLEEQTKRLLRAGVSVTGECGESERRRYRVPVFHLEPVEVERIAPRRQVSPRRIETNLTADDPLHKRVVRTALRALYALGLDFGEIEVWVDDSGRCSVRSANLPPSLPDGRWSAALRRFAAEFAAARGREAAAPGTDPLRIGADPEFVLLRGDGRIVSAARYLDPRGAAGCDAVPIGRRLLYPVAELRPAPAEGPAELAASLQRLLQRAAGRIGEPGLRWLAGGMPVPGLALGGHIHISGAWLNSRLLRTLDSCVAFPLALIEDPAARARRPRYGWLGDFRRKPHGGFEYRTPPSWLVSPAAARAVFALALLAVQEVWLLGGRFGILPAEREELVEAYYAGDKSVLKRGMDVFFNRLTAAGSYAELAVWIDPLLEAISKGRIWDEKTDIRRRWSIPAE